MNQVMEKQEAVKYIDKKFDELLMKLGRVPKFCEFQKSTDISQHFFYKFYSNWSNYLKSRNYTPERQGSLATFSDQELLKLYAMKLSDAEIAKKLKVSSKAVAYRRRKLKLEPNIPPKPKYSEEDKLHLLEKTRALLQEGYTLKEVSEELKIGQRTLREWNKKYKKFEIKRVKKDDIIFLINQGIKEPSEIANKLEISIKNAKRRLQELGYYTPRYSLKEVNNLRQEILNKLEKEGPLYSTTLKKEFKISTIKLINITRGFISKLDVKGYIGSVYYLKGQEEKARDLVNQLEQKKKEVLMQFLREHPEASYVDISKPPYRTILVHLFDNNLNKARREAKIDYISFVINKLANDKHDLFKKELENLLHFYERNNKIFTLNDINKELVSKNMQEIRGFEKPIFYLRKTRYLQKYKEFYSFSQNCIERLKELDILLNSLFNQII
jgi:DNA-binding CsgD family transcriptional regulator